MTYKEFINKLKLYNYNNLPIYVEMFDILCAAQNVIIKDEKIIISFNKGGN